MAAKTNGSTSSIVLVDTQGGLTAIPSKTDLTRINYFDGRFMRADDLKGDQDYVRALVRLSNRAGGAGVVDGFDTTLPDDQTIGVAPGLAIDADGQVLLLTVAQSLDVAELIAATQKAAAPATAIAGKSDFVQCAPAVSTAPSPSSDKAEVYLLTVSLAEAACGEEEVYGDACADPCSSTTNARYLVEGVIFRAVPIALPVSNGGGFSLGQKHTRSLIASAYFGPSAAGKLSLISGTGLHSEVWCAGAAAAKGDVALALFEWRGGAVQFLDMWAARRERMETPPRRYWAARMAMRPWAEYLAQILQFQCQLSEIGTDGAGLGFKDACADKTSALEDAHTMLSRLEGLWKGAAKGSSMDALFHDAPVSFEEITALRKRVGTLAVKKPEKTYGALVDGGIVELPPAGYLPIDDNGDQTVNEQVRALVGDGLDLRFCVVRPDEPAHALEMRQHMDRISLLDGLTGDKPKVDILVPNGRLSKRDAAGPGTEFTFEVSSAAEDPKYVEERVRALYQRDLALLERTGKSALRPSWSTPESAFAGAGRVRPLDGGGGEVAFAGVGSRSTKFYVPIEGEGSIGTAYRLMQRFGETASPGPIEQLGLLWAGLGGGMNATFLEKASEVSKEAVKVKAKEESPPPAPPPPAPAPAPATEPYAPPQVDVVAEAPARRELATSLVPALFGYANIDSDPFSTSLSAAPKIELSLTFAIGRNVIEMTSTGALELDGPPQPTSGHGQVLVSGVARLDATYTFIVAGRRRTTGLRMLQRVMLYKTTASDGSLKYVGVLVSSEGTEELTFHWSPRSQEGGLVMLLRHRELFKTTVIQRDGVLETDNRDSRRVLRALDEIESLERGDPTWRDRASAKLWPPPPDPGGLDVLAGLDWVLFCRRRTEDCGCDQAAAARRRFEVWVMDDDAKDGGVRDPKAGYEVVVEKASRWRALGVVEFPADGYGLVDPAGARDLWLGAVGKKKRVVRESIGMTGKADASWLEIQRLVAFERAVMAKHSAGWKGRRVLPDLPLEAQAPGTDGSILIELGHGVRVYRVLLKSEAITAFQAIHKDGLGALSFAHLLGEMPADDGDTTLTEAWKHSSTSEPYRATVWIPNGYADTADLKAQVRDLLDGLGGDSSKITVIMGDDASGSPAIFLEPYLTVAVYSVSTLPPAGKPPPSSSALGTAKLAPTDADARTTLQNSTFGDLQGRGNSVSAWYGPSFSAVYTTDDLNTILASMLTQIYEPNIQTVSAADADLGKAQLAIYIVPTQR